MYAKKLLICAFLFFICYLILIYLNKKTEAFGYGGRGYGGGRGYYGGRSNYGGRGYPMHMGYYGRNVYPVVVDEYYPRHLYSSYLYPNYWYNLFY
jgi:hypothetical protein